MKNRNLSYMNSYLPYAIADIKGSTEYTNIKGKVKFYACKNGTIIRAEIVGLPSDNKNNFFGFHIHEGSICNQDVGKPAFGSVGNHLNPQKDEHPNHLGDLPMLYSNNGYVYMEFYTNRFMPNDIIYHTVIIHKNKDDLISQPSGNSGEKIACGEILKL